MSKTYYDSFKDTFSSLFYSQGTDSFFGSKGYTTQRAFNYNKPMQDVAMSGDKENDSKGSMLVSYYFLALKNNNLVNTHMAKQLKSIEFNKKMVIPTLIFGAGVTNFIINPLFLSRTSRILRKLVVVLMCTNLFQRKVTVINSLEESIFIENFDYFPNYFHNYLRTKDHRYLLEAKFDINDFDPVTKMPLPGK